MKKRKYTKQKTNPEKIELRNSLKELWLKTKKPLWKRLMQELERPTRLKRVVNLCKLEKVCNDNEKIIVPGKVLGTGTLNKKIFLVAFEFSESAKKKLNDAKIKWMTLKQYIKENSKADFRIIC